MSEALDRAALARNLAALRARVAAACARAGRDPAGVALVAVTKYAGPAFAAALLDLGQLDLGENRTDALATKADALAGRGARWHMIGHLQRNKAKDVAGRIAALHSLDSLDLARRLDGLRSGAPLDVYVEVRLDESTEGRSGVAGADLPAFLAGLGPLARLRVVGLMGLPPQADSPEAARPHFQRLRRLRDELLPGAGLSMGMTEDLEVAVEEGSTVVRVGRALLEGVLPAP